MGFFEEYKKQIITVISIVLVIASLITAGKKTNATFIDNALGLIVTPLQKITSSVTDWFSLRISYITDKRDLRLENERLQARVEELEAENKDLELFKNDYEKLKSLLELSQKYADYETTGTTIIAKDPGSWFDNFIIDKGTNDNLKANMVIIDNGGLVGKITETGFTYSKVESILDSRSSVSAISLRTQDLGVVRGDPTLLNDGLCRMEYIDTEAEVVVGDEIVTSPLSSIYPYGITIGTVKEVKSDSNGLTKYAIIEPQVDFKHLDTLIVIRQLFEHEFSE